MLSSRCSMTKVELSFEVFFYFLSGKPFFHATVFVCHEKLNELTAINKETPQGSRLHFSQLPIETQKPGVVLFPSPVSYFKGDWGKAILWIWFYFIFFLWMVFSKLLTEWSQPHLRMKQMCQSRPTLMYPWRWLQVKYDLLKSPTAKECYFDLWTTVSWIWLWKKKHYYWLCGGGLMSSWFLNDPSE